MNWELTPLENSSLPKRAVKLLNDHKIYNLKDLIDADLSKIKTWDFMTLALEEKILYFKKEFTEILR